MAEQCCKFTVCDDHHVIKAIVAEDVLVTAVLKKHPTWYCIAISTVSKYEVGDTLREEDRPGFVKKV